MKVVLLGTGAADGIPQAFCTCATCSDARQRAIVRTPTCALIDGTVLLDAPPGVGTAAARAGVDLTGVRTIAITHGHSDHWDPSLLLHHSWQFPTSPLRVIAPPSVAEQAQHWLPPGRDDEVIAVRAGDHVDLGDHVITAIPSTHGVDGSDHIAGEAVLFTVTARTGARMLYATDTGPADSAMLSAVGGANFLLVLAELTFGREGPRTGGHLDHSTFPRFLDDLRSVGAITSATKIVAVHLGHHNPPADQLQEQLSHWGATAVADGTHIDLSGTHESGTIEVSTSPTPHSGLGSARRVFITGGARSGKSRFAETLAGTAPNPVCYLATGWPADLDDAWRVRVQAHQQRRPSGWRTVESYNLDDALLHVEPGETVLIDCLSAWVTRIIDDAGAWEDPALAHKTVSEKLSALISALSATPAATVVVVSNEVGSGVVPATESGGLFRDLLGLVNTAVADHSDRVVLVVAGKALELS
jgi:adenosylcobinamide kinase / adenosylcobinamide-phosphate guanylyltransferase